MIFVFIMCTQKKIHIKKRYDFDISYNAHFLREFSWKANSSSLVVTSLYLEVWRERVNS